MRLLASPAGRVLIVFVFLLVFPIFFVIVFQERVPAWLQLGMHIPFSARVSLCALILSAVIALAAIPQLFSLAETSRSTHYSQLDTMYFELLRMAVDNQWLRNPENLTPEQRAPYATYAFCVWNFLETTRDRCAGDQTLKEIWAPVIASEYAIHRRWFYEETTPYWEKEAPKFRLPFADFVWTRFGSPTEPVCGNILHGESGRWIQDSWELRNVDVIRSDPEVRAYLGEATAHTGTGAASLKETPTPED